MRSLFGRLTQALHSSCLNLLDLIPDETQARHITTQFDQGVWRQWRALWGSQGLEMFRCLTERRLEVVNTQTNQACFHPIDEARLLADQVLPLAIRCRASSSWSVGIAAI